MYHVSGLLHVQEAQFDKYHQELFLPSATTNVAQAVVHTNNGKNASWGEAHQYSPVVAGFQEEEVVDAIVIDQEITLLISYARNMVKLQLIVGTRLMSILNLYHQNHKLKLLHQSTQNSRSTKHSGEYNHTCCSILGSPWSDASSLRTQVSSMVCRLSCISPYYFKLFELSMH